MSNSDRILLEDMNHKFTAIMEGLAAMAGVPELLDKMNNRLKSLEIEAKAT